MWILEFYLLTNKEPINRAKLCDFLWGDKGGEKEQRRKLRVTLKNLRKSLNKFPKNLGVLFSKEEISETVGVILRLIKIVGVRFLLVLISTFSFSTFKSISPG